MNMKTFFRSLLCAFTSQLCISGQYFASGDGARTTEKQQHEYSTEHTQVFEEVSKSAILDFTKETAIADSIARGATSDTTVELQLSSFPVVAFNDDETKNEGHNHCENSHLCSLNNDHQSHRCSCHSHCLLFDDCCEDAVQSNNSQIFGRLLRTAYSCYLCNSPIVKAVNIITSCPERYQVEAVVKACNQSLVSREHSTNLDSLSTPVTDGSTGLTYGNIYCAICWDANPDTSEPWLWNFYCNNINYERKNTTTTTSFQSSRNFSNSDENAISMLTFLRTMCEFSFVPPRNFAAPFTECDPTEISTCPSTLHYSTVELVSRCHSAPFGRVYYNNVAYRNVYCFACNHYEDQNLAWSCLPPLDLASPRWNFVILVSPSTESCNPNEPLWHSTGKASDLCSLLARCVVRDRHSIKCTGVCPSEIRNKEGKCRAQNATWLCSFDDVFDERYITCDYWSLFSNDTVIVQINSTVAMCYSCVFKVIENYTVVNGSFTATINGTRRFYNSILGYVKDGLLLAYESGPAATTINPMENDGTGCSSSTLHWGVPLTTFLVSQCCLIVYFALYAASQRLRSFLGQIVLNQTIGLFFGFTFFTLRWITDYSLLVCRPLVILFHYFSTAYFAWTSLLAIEVARALSPSVILARTIQSNRKQVAYYIVGWGSPLILVLLGVAADELALEIRPGHGTWLCFFGGRLGYYVLFAVPMGVCMTIDVVVYVYVIVRLTVVERQTRVARETRLEKLLLSVKLLLVLGFVWAFAIAASFTEVDWIRCAFKVATATQGTFILFIFGLKRDIMATLKCCKSRPKNQATVTSSSSVITMLELPPSN